MLRLSQHGRCHGRCCPCRMHFDSMIPRLVLKIRYSKPWPSEYIVPGPPHTQDTQLAHWISCVASGGNSSKPKLWSKRPTPHARSRCLHVICQPPEGSAHGFWRATFLGNTFFFRAAHRISNFFFFRPSFFEPRKLGWRCDKQTTGRASFTYIAATNAYILHRHGISCFCTAAHGAMC